MAIILNNQHPKNNQQKRQVPLISIKDTVVFPHTEVVLTFGRPKSISAVYAANKVDKIICLVTQKNPAVNNPKIDDIYRIGTMCRIKHILKTDGELNVLVVGIGRVIIETINPAGPFFLAEISQIPEIIEASDEVTALTNRLSSLFKKAANLGKGVDFLVFMRIMSGIQPTELVDQIASVLDIKREQKQKLLETINLKERLNKTHEHLSHEIKILEIESSIASKTQKKFDKSMRENILRERMQTIKKELGEMENEDKDIADFRKKIKQSGMSAPVAQKAKKELKRLSQMHIYNPESGYIRAYLEWLTDMPWIKESKNNVSLRRAFSILQTDHYGLKEVKERILEHLAVMKLRKRNKNPKVNKDINSGTIICFVGPPGVGKTSMGKSIARALGRKFVKVSLGGIRDEAEIRGHRRTYVGSLPGRIIQGIKEAQTNNPVFMLDEIDKVGSDFRGDPSAALLEALDPEQNKDFSDHYLEVPFDLSKVMFITTANVMDTIPPALRDRLEVIRFSSYTEDEKFNIAKKYLIKKALKSTGLMTNEISVDSKALRNIITRYTREAGVRNLERELTKIMRKKARAIAEKKKTKKQLSSLELGKYLGLPKYSISLAEKKDETGVSTGLAWTQSGGDILFIEVAIMPGKGKITLTGKLGDVMKESCKAAVTYLRSHSKLLGIKQDFSKTDIHIHVPEGSVPKDGPSAGVALASALYSALTGKKVKKNIGMTGEITLRGNVLEIGGVKEKVLAAHRAGLKTVLLPKENRKDTKEIPPKVRKEIKIQFVDNLNEVIKKAIV